MLEPLVKRVEAFDACFTCDVTLWLVICLNNLRIHLLLLTLSGHRNNREAVERSNVRVKRRCRVLVHMTRQGCLLDV